MTVPHLIGIFGTGRNGSTLLARLLDGIEGAYVHPVEANFLCAMNDLAWRPIVRRRVIQNAVRHRLKHLDRTIPMRRLLRFYGAHLRELEHDYIPLVAPVALGGPAIDRLRKRQSCTPAGFVPFFLDACAGWTCADRPSDLAVFKSIETPYIADYERLFPDMRFVHIIRDPLEVWASSKRSLVANKALPPWYLGSDYLRTTIDRRWLPHAEAVVARMDQPRHFIVRYEDLIRRPGEIVRNICDWLGTPPPAEPDLQTLLGGRHPTVIQNNPSQRGVPTPRRAVADLHANHRFEDVVSARERDLIVYATQRLARRLGYFATFASPDPGRIWRDWRAVDEWDFRHVSGALSWYKALVSAAQRRIYVWRCCHNPANRTETA